MLNKFLKGRLQLVTRKSLEVSLPEKNVLLLFVFVHGQELLLLGVEEPDDVATLQDVLLVLTMLQEKRNLPRSLRVHHVDLKREQRDLVLGKLEMLMWKPVQWKPPNVITLGQSQTDNIKINYTNSQIYCFESSLI